MFRTLFVNYVKNRSNALAIAILLTAFFRLIQDAVSLEYLIFLMIFLGVASAVFLLYMRETNKATSTLSMYALEIDFPSMVFMGLSSILLKNVEIPGFQFYTPFIYLFAVMMGKVWFMRKHIKLENQLLKVL